MVTFELPMRIVFLAGLIVFSEAALAQQHEADEIIASVDGDPVRVGELNLILAERFQGQALDSLSNDLKRATAHVLVQRRLALRELRKRGGASLAKMVQNQLDVFEAEVLRRGSTVREQAAARGADTASFLVDLAWRVAWGAYLKSKLTDENLRAFFASNPSAYNGTKYQVSQIFIRPASTEAADVKATVDSLKSLQEEIGQSEDVVSAFANAARLHSQSPTAELGGDLGWVESEGDLPAGLLRALRGMEPETISDPIRSSFGAHLVFLHDVEQGEGTYEQLTDASSLRRDAADAMFKTLVDSQSSTDVMWHLDDLIPPVQSR